MKKVVLTTLLLGLFFNLSKAQENNQLDSLSFFYENYQFDAAIDYILDKKLESNSSQRTLAKSYIQLGMYEEAIATYENLVELVPENKAYKVDLAKLYLKVNSLNDALSVFNELIEKDLGNPYYWRNIAFILNKSNRLVEAIQAYRHALNLNPNDHESAHRYAELLLKINEFQEVDSLINQFLVKENSNQRQFLKLKLKSAYAQKDYQTAVTIINRLFVEKDSSLLNIKLAGIAEYRLGNYNRAIELLSLLLSEKIDLEQIHFYLGAAYRATKNYQMAAIQLDAAIKAGVSENIGAYYTQLAANYQDMGEYKNAIDAYKIAYESSQEKILLYHIARTYDLYYKDKKVALNYYEKYLSFSDSSNRDYFYYSKSRVKQLKSDRHFQSDESY